MSVFSYSGSIIPILKQYKVAPVIKSNVELLLFFKAIYRVLEEYKVVAIVDAIVIELPLYIRAT